MKEGPESGDQKGQIEKSDDIKLQFLMVYNFKFKES